MTLVNQRADVPVTIDESLCIQGCTLCVDICPLDSLAINPDNPELDTKKLEGEPYYRLRVGDWRIIYDPRDDVRIMAIEKIKPRGDAYK